VTGQLATVYRDSVIWTTISGQGNTYYVTFDFYEVCDTLLSCVPYNEIQQILLRSGFDDLRIACLERVTDQELLKKLAISDKEELMRIAANDRLKKLIGSDQR